MNGSTKQVRRTTGGRAVGWNTRRAEGTRADQDVLRELLNVTLGFEAPMNTLRGTRVVIRELHGAFELETHFDHSEFDALLKDAQRQYRELPDVQQVYAWRAGDEITFRASLQPWTRENRAKVFEAELALREDYPKASLFFELVPQISPSNLPEAAVLLFGRERV